MIDLTKYVVGGATRPDSFSGMSPDFQTALQSMFEAAPAGIQDNLRVYSGFRSVARQQELWDAALKKYGSPEVARRWVAPPGKSKHNKGFAADLRFLNQGAKDWAHENAKNFGLNFPLGNEPWHIELSTARGGSAEQSSTQNQNGGGEAGKSAGRAKEEGEAIDLTQVSGQAKQFADAPIDNSPKAKFEQMLAGLGAVMTQGVAEVDKTKRQPKVSPQLGNDILGSGTKSSPDVQSILAMINGFGR